MNCFASCHLHFPSPLWGGSKGGGRSGPAALTRLSCGNLAHGFAACAPGDKECARRRPVPNLGIVTSYNDMLSAHQPFETYPAPDQARRRASGRHGAGGGRRAGHVRRRHPGPAGMELSLFSRDVIAMATAIGAVAQHVRRRRLSRRLRQDRAGPGDRRADLRPPAGRLRARRADALAACPTTRRRKVRQLYAEGKVGRAELLEASRSPITGRAPAPSTAPPIPTRC
jgi:phosphogluconate dehydratase